MAIDPNLITTKRVGELPIGAFGLDNKIPHEIGTDLFQGTIADLVAFISPLISAIQYQVITLHVDQAYIDANFIMEDGSTKGLGINLMAGYAIVNGNNGTTNKDGHVGIAYGEVTNVIKQFGGNATHNLSISELPPHNHTNNGSANDNGDPGQFVITSPTNGGESVLVQSSTVGTGTAFSLMQPYLVELQVMKL